MGTTAYCPLDASIGSMTEIIMYETMCVVRPQTCKSWEFVFLYAADLTCVCLVHAGLVALIRPLASCVDYNNPSSILNHHISLVGGQPEADEVHRGRKTG